MTVDKNDDRNWIVIMGDPKTGISIEGNDQAENKAREIAAATAIKHPGKPVFLYQRVGVVIAETKAAWQ